MRTLGRCGWTVLRHGAAGGGEWGTWPLAAPSCLSPATAPRVAVGGGGSPGHLGGEAAVRAPGHEGADPQWPGRDLGFRALGGCPACRLARPGHSSPGPAVTLLTWEEPGLPLTRRGTQSVLPTREATLGPGQADHHRPDASHLVMLALLPKPGCGPQGKVTSCQPALGDQEPKERKAGSCLRGGGCTRMSTTPLGSKQWEHHPAWWPREQVGPGSPGWNTSSWPTARRPEHHPPFPSQGQAWGQHRPPGRDKHGAHRALGVGRRIPGALLSGQLLHVAVHVRAETVGLVEGAAPAGAAARHAHRGGAHSQAVLGGPGGLGLSLGAPGQAPALRLGLRLPVPPGFD